MRRFYQAVVACCLVVLLAACGSTTAFEPQSQSFDRHQGRLHFIRQPSFLSGLGTANIKVDGSPVGSLAAGSYIVADRAAGTHTITVQGPVDNTGFEADIQVEPGVSYYYELGPIVRMNIDLFRLDSMGVTGRPVPGRVGPNSPYMFYSLDAIAGATSVANLKARKT
jgi:uncharacterized protein DUF2846